MINSKEIAEIIASQSGRTKKFSEQFLKELISVISEYLQRDGVVKVKGLGTFKVIRVEERKSVDVSTGNQIVIPSHEKIQFLPEEAVKESVNEQYSHLETTILEVPEGVKVKPAENSATSQQPSESNRQTPEEPKKKKSLWWVWIIVLLVVLAAVYFTKPLWREYAEQYFGKDSVAVEVLPVVEDNKSDLYEFYTDSLDMADSLMIEGTDSVASESDSLETEVYVEETQPFDIDSYTYKFAMEAPVREEVTVIDGSRLTMVAYRAYGRKEFWVYVYDANRNVLRRPDGVAKGMQLKIADLPAELVDPNSQKAIDKALELAKKY